MYSTDVEKARRFAEKVHANQVDKSGMPYIEHLERVARRVDTDAARVVAWLHDTVEDTAVTPAQIAELFGPATAEAVRCMTHGADEPYEAYLIRAKSNPVSRAVKISDLIDNSNLSRLPVVSLRDVERQAKYNRALRFMLED